MSTLNLSPVFLPNEQRVIRRALRKRRLSTVWSRIQDPVT